MTAFSELVTRAALTVQRAAIALEALGRDADPADVEMLDATVSDTLAQLAQDVARIDPGGDDDDG